MSKKSTAAVIARLKILTKTDTDTGLAGALGISPQTLSSWKSRESTPYAICVDLAESRKVSLDWILMGEGSDTPIESPNQGSDLQEFTRAEAEMVELFRELSEADQRVLRTAVEEKIRLKGLERMVDDLHKALADIKRPA